MKDKITVLGGMGQMGQLVAEDLYDAGFDVNILDLKLGHNICDRDFVLNEVRHSSAVVGCLPSSLGKDAVQMVAGAGYNYIDLSFTASDLSEEVSVPDGTTVVHDCGLCPGISNMILGDAARRFPNNISDVNIYVGGVSKDKNLPLGYTVTWCVDDLLEEYRRPARFLENGVLKAVDPLSDEARSYIEHRGETFEVFKSDGLRSLLKMPYPTITEWTIRWPGHVDAIRKLLQKGDDAVKAALPRGESDRVVMLVYLGDDKIGELDVCDHKGVSAMARTTALTCSAITQAVAVGEFRKRGVLPSEYVGMEEGAYSFVKRRMSYHGIRWDV